MKKIPVECYSRIVGYFRPINQVNPGKASEIADRKMLKYEERLNGESKKTA